MGFVGNGHFCILDASVSGRSGDCEMGTINEGDCESAVDEAKKYIFCATDFKNIGILQKSSKHPSFGEEIRISLSNGRLTMHSKLK